jgi:flagellar protein FlaJ
VYDDELDELIDTETVTDPADMIVGRAVWKILAVAVVSLPLFAYILSTGVLISDPGLFIIVFGGLISSLILAISLLLIWLLLATASVSDRGNRIETVLPEAMSFMYAQSKSDVNYLNVIRSIALAEDAYGPVSREFQKIVRRCEYFGEDLETAIEKQAKSTPSDELERILTGLRSHIQNGADVTKFFEREAEAARERIESKESATLDLFNMISTLYMVVGLGPILIFAVVVGLATFQPIPAWVFGGIAYVFTPAVTLFFIFLVGRAATDRNRLDTLTDYRENLANSVHQVSQEEGYSSPQRTLSTAFGKEDQRVDKGSRTEVGRPKHIAATGIFTQGNSRQITEFAERFDKVRKRETKLKLKAILTDPIGYLIELPTHILAVSVPLTAVVLEILAVYDILPLMSIDAIVNSPATMALYWLFLPGLLTFGPLALFYQLQTRRTTNIRQAFPDTLQKIINTEESGATLTTAIENVATNKTNIVDEEMEIVAAKTKLGVPLDRSLIEFNNVYKNPQVARGTRLLIEAYRASSHVSEVLEETVESARLGLKIADQKRRQTQLQMLYIILIAAASSVILFIVSDFFVELSQQGLALDGLGNPQRAFEEGTQNRGASATIMEMTIFHAALLNSILAGIFIGYMSDQTLKNGIKYVLGLAALTIGIWVI